MENLVRLLEADGGAGLDKIAKALRDHAVDGNAPYMKMIMDRLSPVDGKDDTNESRQNVKIYIPSNGRDD